MNKQDIKLRVYKFYFENKEKENNMLQLTSSQRTFQRPPSTDISRVQNNHLPEKRDW